MAWQIWTLTPKTSQKPHKNLSRHRGRLSFPQLSLASQRKVSRPLRRSDRLRLPDAPEPRSLFARRRHQAPASQPRVRAVWKINQRQWLSCYVCNSCLRRKSPGYSTKTCLKQYFLAVESALGARGWIGEPMRRMAVKPKKKAPWTRPVGLLGIKSASSPGINCVSSYLNNSNQFLSSRLQQRPAQLAGVLPGAAQYRRGLGFFRNQQVVVRPHRRAYADLAGQHGHGD